MCYVLCRVQPRCHHEQLINTFQHTPTHFNTFQHTEATHHPNNYPPCSVFYPHSSADAALAAGRGCLKRSLKPRCCCAVLVCCVETTPTLPPPPRHPWPRYSRHQPRHYSVCSAPAFCVHCNIQTLHSLLLTIIITCLRREAFIRRTK